MESCLDQDLTDTITDYLAQKESTQNGILNDYDNRCVSPDKEKMEEITQHLNELQNAPLPKPLVEESLKTPPPSPADVQVETEVVVVEQEQIEKTDASKGKSVFCLLCAMFSGLVLKKFGVFVANILCSILCNVMSVLLWNMRQLVY